MFRGNVFSNIKQYEQAIKDYNKAIELAPSESIGIIYKARGEVYKNLAETEKAQLDFENAKKYHNKKCKIIKL